MDAERLVRLIAEDRTHGSTALALLAIDGIREVVSQFQIENPDQGKQALLTLLRTLRKSRPSMAAVNNLLLRLEHAIATLQPTSAKEFMQQSCNECDELELEVQTEQQAVVANMIELIKDNEVIMTHSISSTIKRICVQLAKARKGNRIVVTESRPGNEGKLLAEFLAALNMEFTYITEAQIDLLMPEVNKVVVGADAILEDGSIINKAGSTLMALSAAHHGVPVFVCAEKFKTFHDSSFELEEMNPEELGLTIDGADVRNTYFERVPVELIARWVS